MQLVTGFLFCSPGYHLRHSCCMLLWQLPGELTSVHNALGIFRAVGTLHMWPCLSLFRCAHGSLTSIGESPSFFHDNKRMADHSSIFSFCSLSHSQTHHTKLFVDCRTPYPLPCFCASFHAVPSLWNHLPPPTFHANNFYSTYFQDPVQMSPSL